MFVLYKKLKKMKLNQLDQFQNILKNPFMLGLLVMSVIKVQLLESDTSAR